MESRIKIRLLYIALAVIMMMEVFFTGNVMAEEKAGESGAEWQTDTVYEGRNIENQNYLTWSHPVRSYLTACQNGGFMRVQDIDSDAGILVEYYDPSYRLLSSRMIEKELPLFGAFYETGQYYFLLTGQLNMDERPDVEVYRITKYDKDWNRISSAGLSDCNTVEPFRAGSARMDTDGKYLYIRTCHSMYKSLRDGLNHQANVSIILDIEAMNITESYTAVSRSPFGYVSHSFNQFIKADNDMIAAVDHGDAYPRQIQLVVNSTKSPSALSAGGKGTCILSFPGRTGENKTGASVGGFEMSGSSYLVAGNSVIQDEMNLKRETRNIFVASVDRYTDAVSVNWLTNYLEGEESVSTPCMARLSDSRYMILWSRGGTTVFYTLLDGNGKQEGRIYELKGSLSDCEPLVENGRLIWYTWKDEAISFYEIDLQDLSQYRIKQIVNGRKEDDKKENDKDSSRDQEIISENDGKKDPDDSEYGNKDQEYEGDENTNDGSNDGDTEENGQQEDVFSAPAAGTRLTDRKSKAVYKVTKAGLAGGTAAFLKPSESSIKKITIPASVKLDGITYKVTSISADACKNHKMLQSVSVVKNVFSIGRNAFYGCTNLKNVSVGKNVKTIGDKAFYKCTALPQIIIPEKVSKIGKQAFYGDKKLASIVIQTKKLTNGRIGNGAFGGIGSGAVYTVPRVKVQAYKKLLIAKGADL